LIINKKKVGLKIIRQIINKPTLNNQDSKKTLLDLN